jgi:outer membrane protein OmpA-like peptidoglycan-associated protein
MKIFKLIISIIIILSFFFVTCENPIMQKWWDDLESGQETTEATEYEYVPIVKIIPMDVLEVIIEHEIVYEIIREQLSPELVVEYISIFEFIYEYIYETIVEIVEINKVIEIEVIREMTREELIEIIRELPPEVIYQYLTDEQIKYIIIQQPPSVILQTISIIGIEYIIFSGDSTEFNAPSPVGGTSLTTVEKNTNTATIDSVARALASNDDYLIILHGHANPGASSSDQGLIKISEDRAFAVEDVLKKKFFDLSKMELEDERISTSGYGGEKILSGTTSIYAGLNRRVEMILIKVEQGD